MLLTSTNREAWVRYDNRTMVHWDWDCEIVTGRVEYLQRTTYEVVKHTPKGVWLRTMELGRPLRWVSKTGKKRFAYPTDELALESLRARKRRQLGILKLTTQAATRGLKLAEEELRKLRAKADAV